MLAKEEMKRRRMVKTPTSVLFARDWTIFLVIVCRAAGKSLNANNKEKARQESIPLVKLAEDI